MLTNITKLENLYKRSERSRRSERSSLGIYSNYTTYEQNYWAVPLPICSKFKTSIKYTIRDEPQILNLGDLDCHSFNIYIYIEWKKIIGIPHYKKNTKL